MSEQPSFSVWWAFPAYVLLSIIAVPVASYLALAGIASQNPALFYGIEIGIVAILLAFSWPIYRLISSPKALSEQQNKQDAIFRSMREGVLVLDPEKKIISLNRAATKLLKTSQEEAAGRSLLEVVKNEELRNFLLEASQKGEFVEDIELRDQKELTFLQVRRVSLEDERGEAFGSLFVLNNVTRLKRLENIKTDLVANVSHELKTPITSIKGFVETLLDGALENPEDSKRFLQIISRHSDRMTAIIEDLLTLARLEGHNVKELMLLQEESLGEIVGTVVDVCRSKAEEKDIVIEVDCGKEVAAVVDRSLVEQALINLVDNAIKYSERSSKVLICAEQEKDSVEICISDQGPGIEKSHLPRLFERFYRVDRARSRNMGGTGLGLAIVKHIVSAHDGSLRVDSEVGKGSKFSISLPLQ